MLYKRILIYQFTDDVSIFYTVLCMYLHSFPCRCSASLLSSSLWEQTPLSTVVRNCHSNRKYLSSRLKQILHGKTKNLTAKPQTSKQKQKLTEKWNYFKAKAKPHVKKKPHTGSVQSLKFLKKSWNLQSNFPDLNKVWKREILVWKNGKKSGIGSFRTLVYMSALYMKSLASESKPFQSCSTV